jgi:hypothetical protein
MATALKLRRGTTSQHSTFTGAEGEVTVDTTKDTVVVHDGATAGGFPLATEKGANTFTANQIISVTDNTNAALRITQAGTGDALLVEDEANPDSTPFVIKNDGKVGIGVSVPSYPLDITLLEATSRIYSTQAGKGAMRLFSTTTGTMYVGKDYEGSSGWWGSGGEYVIAGTGNYPMEFWTNSVKQMSISSAGIVNLANALPASSGGTGLTAPGTSGNILTSNGTTWTSVPPATSVTSLNGQTGAITNTDYGAIGSYVTAASNALTTLAEYTSTTTVAGSSLVYSTATAGPSPALGGTSSQNMSVTTTASQSASLSGTWRLMTRIRVASSTTLPIGLWVRIS